MCFRNCGKARGSIIVFKLIELSVNLIAFLLFSDVPQRRIQSLLANPKKYGDVQRPLPSVQPDTAVDRP